MARTKEVKKVDIATKNNDYKMMVVNHAIVSEKASNLSSKGVYIFDVKKNANKIGVARDIKGAYGVNPFKVNMLRRHGKVVGTGKSKGQRSSTKRAIVIMPSTKRLPLFEQK